MFTTHTDIAPTSGAYVPKSKDSVIVISHVAAAVSSASPSEIRIDLPVPLKLKLGDFIFYKINYLYSTLFLLTLQISYEVCSLFLLVLV
jgi:hypothetical protein